MNADEISEQAVLNMLGQANTDLILKILQACLNGQTAVALDLFATADACGAEPDVFIADMLDNIHLASLIAGGANSSEQPEAQSQMLIAIATAGIARLGRAWQLLLNSHREIKDAPNPKTAAQMVLIRLAHIAPMPTPAEIIKSLPEAPVDAPTAQTSTSVLPSKAPRTEAEPVPAQVAPTQIPQTETSPVETNIPSQLANEKSSPAQTVFSSLQDIAISLNEAGEKILAARLRQHLRPVSLEDGKLEVQIDGDVKQENFLGDLARFMSQKSGQPWLVSQAAQGGGQTLAELDRQADEQKKKAAAEHPIVAAILDKFDSAEITAVRPHNAKDEIHSDDEVKNA